MVLIKNNGGEIVKMSWETTRYVLQPGETAKVGGAVARAFERRYPDVMTVQTDDVIQEPIAAPEPTSETSEPFSEVVTTEPESEPETSTEEEDEDGEVPPPPSSPKAPKLSPAQIRAEARKQRKR